jgi:hypothetical protein
VEADLGVEDVACPLRDALEPVHERRVIARLELLERDHRR